MEYSSKPNSIIINYLGLGMFSWLAANLMSNLFDEILRNILISSGLDPKLNFWLTGTFTLMFFSLILILFINNLRKKDLTVQSNFKKPLIISIIIAALCIAIQVNNELVFDSLGILSKGENWNKYFDTICMGEFFSYTGRIFYFLRFPIIAIVIFRKIKGPTGSNTSSSDILDL